MRACVQTWVRACVYAWVRAKVEDFNMAFYFGHMVTIKWHSLGSKQGWSVPLGCKFFQCHREAVTTSLLSRCVVVERSKAPNTFHNAPVCRGFESRCRKYGGKFFRSWIAAHWSGERLVHREGTTTRNLDPCCRECSWSLRWEWDVITPWR